MQNECAQWHGRWIHSSIKHRPSFDRQYSVCNVLINGRPLVHIRKLRFRTQTNLYFVSFLSRTTTTFTSIQWDRLNCGAIISYGWQPANNLRRKLACCKHWQHPHINLVTNLSSRHSSLNFVYRISYHTLTISVWRNYTNTSTLHSKKGGEIMFNDVSIRWLETLELWQRDRQCW